MNRILSPRVESPGLEKRPERLRILVLGTPEIIAAGTPFNLNHQKAQALLYYLATTARATTREHLATLLWGDADERDALHSLRSSLYHLRQMLRSSGVEDAIGGEGEWLGLQAGTYTSDVEEFRRLLDNSNDASIKQAVSLYRGPFLQGFSMSDAAAFDSWQQSEESSLSQACFQALDQLASAAEQKGESAGTINFLQQMAQMDPLDEAVLQRLIRACIKQGEAGLALRQYRFFEKSLRQELSLEPSAETKSLLHDALRQEQDHAAVIAPVDVKTSEQSNVLPLIGRDALLQELIEISRKALEADGSTVLIEGEAGIGKTRLIEEFTNRLAQGSPPWTVLQGSCSPFDDLLSFGPFLEALQDASAGGLPELPVQLDPSLPDTRGRFSWRVLQKLRSLTHDAPLALIIEDLQWANSSTLNLFGFLSMRLHTMPVLLIGSVQHADSIPALQRLVSLGRRRGGLHLMPLAALTLDGVATVLQSLNFETDSIEILSDWLYSRSSGSPFLLTEILAQLRNEAIIQPTQGGWQIDTSRWWRWRTTFELPETTHDLVAWRLAGLAPETRHLLDILAVAGQALPAALLASLPGVKPEEFSPQVEDLLARRLLIEPPGGKLALPHHLLRETLLHRLSSLQQRMIHRQLAETLEEHMSWEDPEALHLFALHAVAGEDIGRARRYGLAALPNLPQDYTGAETVEFVHHLHDLLAPSASPREMATLTRSLGALHQSLGHMEVASQWLTESLTWARKAGDLSAQATAHFEMSELSLAANDHRKAMEAARAGISEIDAATALSQLDPATRLVLTGRGRRLLGAAFAMEGSDLATAENHLQEAVTALRQTGSLGDLCAGLFELGNIAAQRGDLQGALAFYDEAARTARKGHIHYYLALALNNFAYHNLLLGRIEPAERAAAEGVKVAEAYDLLAALLHLYSTRGEIHLYLAEWQQAEDSFRRGLDIAEDLGSLERKAGYRGGLALAARGRGDSSKAVSLLLEGLSMISEAGYWHLRTRLQLWLAETYSMQEKYTEAESLLETALETARQHRRMLLEVQGECLRATLLAVHGQWDLADRLFAETMRTAEEVGLELEKARLKAAWGKTAWMYSPDPSAKTALLLEAREIFEACRAEADLKSLPKDLAATRKN